MRTRSNALLPAVVMVVAVLAILTSLLRMVQINNWNKTLRDSFLCSPDTSLGPRYELPALEDVSDRTFELKREIKYYDAPNGNVVKVLPAGTYLQPHGESVPLIYGWVSVPTDTKGWRQVGAFGNVDDLANDIYYAKLSDLRRAATDAMGDSAKESLDVTFASFDGKELSRTFTRVEYETLRLDIYDYEHGTGSANCPPDLEAPIFTSQTVFGLVAGVVLVGWSIVLFVARSREARGESE